MRNSTDALYPYCYTNTFIEHSLHDYGCASEILEDGTVYPTFSGESSLESSLEAAVDSLLSHVGQSSVTEDNEVATSLLSELASLTSEASFGGGAGGGAGATNTLNSGPSPSSFSTSSNAQSQSIAPGIIAAIAVPSAVGAIALVGFIVWLTFYLRRRNRRRHAWQNPIMGPYTQGGGQQPPMNTYPDTYAVNKDFASPTTVHQLSPSNPSMSAVSPYPSSPGAGDLEVSSHGRHSSANHSLGLNRENLDALSASSPSGAGEPRGSEELARQRRLSDDRSTTVPMQSVAGRTNWTADSFNIMGGRR